ncbi:hypothetical protein JW921_05930 [Candidatus Fermentibacterales bacterium]|nr:hypothetical protein [Candidatus Fermentibacterales bacterium]
MGEDMRESMGRMVGRFEEAGYPVVAWTYSDALPACETYLGWQAMPSRACVVEVIDWQQEEEMGSIGVFRDPDYEMAVVDDGGPGLHSATCEGCPIAHCPQRGA